MYDKENEGAGEPLKYEKNSLYRFKDEKSASRDFLNIMKKDERELRESLPANGGNRANKYPANSKTVDQ